ncbi:MAG: 30S ribosomal protein S27ae [Candidatus Bathyarchaeia archaeon]
MSEKAESPPKKGKTEKGKRKEKNVYMLYKIEKDKLVRQRPTCERCGPGYFMADHKDRYACGRCGFTRYKHA